MSKKTLIITSLIVAVIAIGAAATYVTLRQGGKEVARQEVATTAEKTTPQPEKPVAQLKEPTTTEPIDVSDWKTYRNEEYGFELKHPIDWSFSFEKKTYEGKSIFFISMKPSRSILKRMDQEYPPSIGIIVKKAPQDWESKIYQFQEKLVAGPEKIDFKGRNALKIVEFVGIDIPAFVQSIIFSSPDEKWLFDITFQRYFNLQKFQQEDYFTEVYNNVLDSFKFLPRR